MTDLLTFFERTMGYAVPMEARAWLREHVDPHVALMQGHAVHLLWLSSVCEEWTSREIVEVCFARMEARVCHEAMQRGSEEPPPVDGGLLAATERLREAVRATRWWVELVKRWEARQSRGLGIARYMLAGADVQHMRGTRVGRFAVRELAWADGSRRLPTPLRYREKTPWGSRHSAGPQWVYAVDHVATGKSLGTFASAAVAFEVADRFDRWGVIEPPVPPALQRLLDVYRGGLPRLGARSWPAEPHWSFGECRRRAVQLGRTEHRGEEVGDAR